MVAGAAVASSVTITNGREDSSNVWLQAAFFSDTTLSAQGTTWHGTYVHTCDARKHGDLKANASVRWGRVCRGARMVVVVVVCLCGGGERVQVGDICEKGCTLGAVCTSVSGVVGCGCVPAVCVNACTTAV
jgi:hypothetical protein